MSNGQDDQGSLVAFAQYLREVRSTPLLVEEEEAALLQCIEQAKKEAVLCSARQREMQQARNRLIQGYQSFVVRIARRYAPRVKEMDLEDLIQEGNCGLLQALDRYDSARSEASFNTWAYSWVQGTIRLALLREGSIRLPIRKVKAMKKLERVATTLYGEFGREPTYAEIAQAMEITERELRELIVLQAQSETVSLYRPLDDCGETFVEDVLADSTQVGCGDEGVSSIEEVLTYLTEKERAVLLFRCGFGEERALTQKEVADRLDMKLAKVQKLDRHARLRLRRLLETQSA